MLCAVQNGRRRPSGLTHSMTELRSKPLTVIGISGTLSTESSTVKILQLALDGAQAEGAVVQLLDLREWELPFCDGRDDYSSYPQRVQDFRHAVRSAQGVIFASPEYHNSLSGVLKNAMDLLTPDDLGGKMCGLIGVAGGSQGAINALNSLRTICRGFGAWVVPQQVSISNAGSSFNDDGSLRDDMLAKRIRHLGIVVATNARLHSPVLTHP